MERKSTCPHCGSVIVVKGEEWELDYNCPIMICPACQKEFLKDNCKEIAIDKVSFDDKLPISLWALGCIAIGIILVISSFDFGSSIMIFRYKNLIFGVLAIIAGFGMAIAGVKNFKRKNIYLKEEDKNSKIRCSNAEYVAKLNALGYKKK